jgi:hypothetical protein
MHLWEIDHPYYCNEGNYYATESVCSEYDSWAEFFQANGYSDPDLNLVFRWDWRKTGTDWEEEHDTLLIFWMGQRKGLYRYSRVKVTDDDEPSVKKWLAERWERMKLLWAGISDAQTEKGK